MRSAMSHLGAWYRDPVKKTLGAVAALLLSLLLTSCGSTQDPAGDETSEPPATSQFVPNEPKTVQPTVTCSEALRAAAEVEEVDNNAELLASLTSCETADDWIAALQQNPGAGGRTSYSPAEAARFLWLNCGSLEPNAAVCIDGIEKGYFKL